MLEILSKKLEQKQWMGTTWYRATIIFVHVGTEIEITLESGWYEMNRDIPVSAIACAAESLSVGLGFVVASELKGTSARPD